MGQSIADADAGHVRDELKVITNKTKDAAHHIALLAQDFHEETSSVRYPATAIGRDVQRMVDTHVGNRMGQMQSIVTKLDSLVEKIHAGMRVQEAQDSENSDAMSRIGHAQSEG